MTKRSSNSTTRTASLFGSVCDTICWIIYENMLLMLKKILTAKHGCHVNKHQLQTNWCLTTIHSSRDGANEHHTTKTCTFICQHTNYYNYIILSELFPPITYNMILLIGDSSKLRGAQLRLWLHHWLHDNMQPLNPSSRPMLIHCFTFNHKSPYSLHAHKTPFVFSPQDWLALLCASYPNLSRSACRYHASLE